MASITLLQLLILSSVVLPQTPTAREMPTALIMKLENDGSGSSDCWTALAEIRSCSNEIIGFFLNGQTDIDRPCCLAAATIARRCWPALIGSLGYSPEEFSFLEGYCQKTEATTTAASPEPFYVLP